MGTSGHMQHPFDIPSVKTGQDLINYFERIVEHLSENPGSVKFDGINVSFKLVDDESTPTGKDFRMDRGTSAPESVIGMTAADAYKKWPEGHGMPPAIDELLKIFNEALPLIEPELKSLGMWDDPTKYFNTEYMKKGKTNVVEYDEKILALHGVNQFYEKKAQAHRIKKGIGMDRPGLERPIDPETGKPTKHGSTEVPYDSGVLQSIIEKVKPIAEQHEVSLVGDVSTEIFAEVDFSETLNKPFTINMTDTKSETYSLGEWLSSAVNPFDAKVQKRDGKQAWAISKEIYFAVLNGVPLMEMLETPEDVKTAINGALFNHATHELGMDVKRASISSKGGLEGHEGIVIRGIDDRPVKVTGDFIVKGAGGAIKDKIKAAKEETLDEVADQPGGLELDFGDDLEEKSAGRKMVAIYPGRFQPMGRHHAEVYKALLNDERFDDVFMSTSDKVEMPKSPFNFKEKQEIAAGHDIDPSKIVQTKNPYNAVEITNSLDPETVVVYFVGCKDMDADPNVCDGTKPRFPRENLGGVTKKGTPRYFRDFEDEENFKGVKDHAYIAVAPHIEIEIPELGEMSGTTIRQALRTAEPEKFESIMGFYDPLIYELIKDKLAGRELEESQLPLGIFLRLIEEIVQEASTEQMFGSSAAYVKDITNPASYKRDDSDKSEEDEEELEEISAMGAGAVEGSAGKRDSEEEESLIREVMEYILYEQNAPSPIELAIKAAQPNDEMGLVFNKDYTYGLLTPFKRGIRYTSKILQNNRIEIWHEDTAVFKPPTKITKSRLINILKGLKEEPCSLLNCKKSIIKRGNKKATFEDFIINPNIFSTTATEPNTTTTNVVTHCGNPYAPKAGSIDNWEQYKCGTKTSEACLSWNVYTTNKEQGCPDKLVCCPPKKERSEYKTVCPSMPERFYFKSRTEYDKSLKKIKKDYFKVDKGECEEWINGLTPMEFFAHQVATDYRKKNELPLGNCPQHSCEYLENEDISNCDKRPGYHWDNGECVKEENPNKVIQKIAKIAKRRPKRQIKDIRSLIKKCYEDPNKNNDDCNTYESAYGRWLNKNYGNVEVTTTTHKKNTDKTPIDKGNTVVENFIKKLPSGMERTDKEIKTRRPDANGKVTYTFNVNIPEENKVINKPAIKEFIQYLIDYNKNNNISATATVSGVYNVKAPDEENFILMYFDQESEETKENIRGNKLTKLDKNVSKKLNSINDVLKFVIWPSDSAFSIKITTNAPEETVSDVNDTNADAEISTPLPGSPVTITKSGRKRKKKRIATYTDPDNNKEYEMITPEIAEQRYKHEFKNIKFTKPAEKTYGVPRMFKYLIEFDKAMKNVNHKWNIRDISGNPNKTIKRGQSFVKSGRSKKYDFQRPFPPHRSHQSGIDVDILIPTKLPKSRPKKPDYYKLLKAIKFWRSGDRSQFIMINTSHKEGLFKAYLEAEGISKSDIRNKSLRKLKEKYPEQYSKFNQKGSGKFSWDKSERGHKGHFHVRIKAEGFMDIDNDGKIYVNGMPDKAWRGLYLKK